MPNTYIYPEAQALKEINQDLIPNLQKNRFIFDIFPVTKSDVTRLRWSQRDNYIGLQQLRGFNGQHPRVAAVGSKVYDFAPGVYGEYLPIEEEEALLRAAPGTYDQGISLNSLVMERNNQLMQRMFDRIEKILWDAASGTYSVSAKNGAIVATDSFPVKTFTASTTWSNTTSSTPLTDIRTVQQKQLGSSVSFGPDATLWMNGVTINGVLQNTNALDLGGRRLEGGATFNSLNDINRVLAGNGLPQINRYDGFYLADGTSTVTKFIPDNRALLVGARSNGDPVGEYRMTRNFQITGYQPDYYCEVIDTLGMAIDREIGVRCGHNGGPVIYYPSALVWLTV